MTCDCIARTNGTNSVPFFQVCALIQPYGKDLLLIACFNSFLPDICNSFVFIFEVMDVSFGLVACHFFTNMYHQQCGCVMRLGSFRTQQKHNESRGTWYGGRAQNHFSSKSDTLLPLAVDLWYRNTYSICHRNGPSWLRTRKEFSVGNFISLHLWRKQT